MSLFIIINKETKEEFTRFNGGEETPEIVMDKTGFDPNIYECIKKEDVSVPIINKVIPEREAKNHLLKEEMGHFGNVWVRKLYFPTKDIVHPGHEHKHDHVSLLAHGSVMVEVEGEPVTKFTAPTFITIAANKKHKITALEDETVWFCVFALRDKDGELTDLYNGDNSPYTHIFEK